jgi:DNA-cytosine methyltransferase
LSLFDGISCGQLALKRAGISVDKYYSSEIDESAIAVTQYNFPDTLQLGDITKWKEWNIDWSSIDLVMGGFPCQAFSLSGQQNGFDDPRGKLFFTFVDIVKHVLNNNPNAKFLGENVVMKSEYESVIDEAIGYKPICINSALVSAQSRQRLYWANFKITQPENKGITWGDVHEHGVNEYYYTEKALQWLARHSRIKNKTLDIWQDDEKDQMYASNDYKNYSSQRFFGICDLPSDKECIAAMRGRYLGDSQPNKTQQYIEFRYDGKSNALTTVQKDGIVVPFTLPNRIPADMFFFRYKTPIECERLQTLPDNYTKYGLVNGKEVKMSNTQRYKQVGNGWTVDVIVHIFECMKRNETNTEVFKKVERKRLF